MLHTPLVSIVRVSRGRATPGTRDTAGVSAPLFIFGAHANLTSNCRFLTRFVLQKPERDEWGSGVEALECALQLEKSVNQSLLDLHKLCSDHNDPHVRAQLWHP